MGTRQFIVAGLMLAFTAGLVAQGGQIRPEIGPTIEREVERSAVNFSERWRPKNQNGATKVTGSVIDVRQVPVAKATVQLRNLDTGTVESTTEADENGEYEFTVEESGTYIVEMIMVDGAVVALSNAGSLATYETLQTVVQLPGRWDTATHRIFATQSLTNFLGMSAETSMTTQTIQIAIENNIKPVAQGIPASPTSS